MSEKAMRSNAVIGLVAVLSCGHAALAPAEDQPKDQPANQTKSQPKGRSAPDPVAALTPQQFEALPPTAIIEVDGRRITKELFLSRREAALNRAFDQMKAQRACAAAEFAAARKAFLDGETATREAANRKVFAEGSRLRSADAEQYGPNWDARREQAATLLKLAAAADRVEESRLEQQAADLLAPVRAAMKAARWADREPA